MIYSLSRSSDIISINKIESTLLDPSSLSNYLNDAKLIKPAELGGLNLGILIRTMFLEHA